MNSTVGTLVGAFRAKGAGTAPGWWRRGGASGTLPVLLLIACGLGMVVLTQWLHPAGPIEDPLITQEQTNF